MISANVLRRARLDRRPQQAESLAVSVKLSDIAIRNRRATCLFFMGALDDLVVDVGKVARIGDVEAEKSK